MSFTDIICILDRSGSMRELAEDTRGGFNAFIERQKTEEGRARVSLVLFDDHYEQVYQHVEIQNVPVLSEKVYYARGMTALLDAVGRTLAREHGLWSASHADERPAQVVVLITTDGHENASKEFKLRGVRKLVEACEKDGWEFVFLGAEVDAFDTTTQMGMSMGSASVVAKSGGGMREAYSKMNRAVSQVRRTGRKGNVDDELDEDGWV